MDQLDLLYALKRSLWHYCVESELSQEKRGDRPLQPRFEILVTWIRAVATEMDGNT